MRPVTRLQHYRHKEYRLTQFKARKMDGSFVGKFGDEPPYFTRSSPKKKDRPPKGAMRASQQWDDQRRSLLFSMCVEDHLVGKCSGAGLKPESLKKFASEMNSKFCDDCTSTQVRNFRNKQK